MTIPEVGRVAAETPPAVIVTSNRTRELHDALKRRCLYHWIDHPQLDREVAIVRARAPHVSEALARDVAERRGPAARDRSREAAGRRGDDRLGERAGVPGRRRTRRRPLAADTLGAVVKDHEDQELVVARLAEVVGDDG